jgi:hypothetical protein
MLNEKVIKSNLKKWGFKSFDSKVHDHLNSALERVTERFAKQSSRASRGVRQAGGRIVLPSEYFGVDSGRYEASVSDGSNLNTTDSWIRSPLSASDPTGVITGGAQKRFACTTKAVKEVAEKLSSYEFKQHHIKQVKAQFETRMTKFMNSVDRRNKNGETHLSVGSFKEVADQKQYSDLF